VEIADQPLITYGKVTPQIAHRILSEHIGKGLVVQEYVIENI
jgi:NADP-reducing hydrogenase subunit HndB